ncbi:reverse transcriptase domain-containing protein [Tanacetum coccineum]
MSASRQGMSSEEMEQVVAQRVANAIEAIAICEKWGSDQGRNFDQQQSRRIEMVRAHATRAGNKKAYVGNLTYCNKCKLHHTGPCIVKCGNCKRVGHMKKYCRTSAPATIKRAPIANQKPVVTCFRCGAERHFKSKCPIVKNKM